MRRNRRELIRLAGMGSAGVLSVAAPVAAGAEDGPAGADGVAAVLVDTTACIGCRKCEWACNVENELSARSAVDFEDQAVLDRSRRPVHDAFTVVNRFGSSDQGPRRWSIKLQCLHCLDPACSSACLVGALRKRPGGPVTYDAWKCIGCRYCMIACPFQVPAYEYDRAVQPRVRKCTFCAPRLADGKVPACVAICPNEALTFGLRGDLLAAAHTRIRMRPGRYVDHVYGEAEVGGTSWLYLAPVEFARTGLPTLGSEPIPDRTERIQHGVFKSFVPPLALYGVLGLIMHSLRGENGFDRGEGTHG